MEPQERKDHHTTVVNGTVVYLNPLPTDYKDRIIWAFFNASAIGANRAARGYEQLDQLAKELKLDTRDLRGYLRGLQDAEARAKATNTEEIAALVEAAIDMAIDSVFKDVEFSVVLAIGR